MVLKSKPGHVASGSILFYSNVPGTFRSRIISFLAISALVHFISLHFDPGEFRFLIFSAMVIKYLVPGSFRHKVSHSLGPRIFQSRLTSTLGNFVTGSFHPWDISVLGLFNLGQFYPGSFWSRIVSIIDLK